MQADMMVAERPDNAPDLFGVYIHWPFCASKCPYCDFNSHVREAVDHAAWREALVQEIKTVAAQVPDRIATSIFFGGGTPSLMEASTIEAVIDAVRQCWGLMPEAEITLEANPTSVEAAKFKAFRSAGINRVSLGVQSLRTEDLKFLGRTHFVSDAMQAIEIAGNTFDRYSFDLIYARPDQSLKDWAQELESALEFAGDHLSLYQLTIEQGTAFHTWHARGDFQMPEDDTGGDFYELTQAILDDAGLPAYEISNHARPGEESRHNLTYWRYGDYAGIGPGAHGRLSLPDGGKVATRTHRAPEIWLERVRADGHGMHPHEALGREQRFTEALMMGLRMREGVSLSRLSAEAASDWQKIIDTKRIDILCDEGLLTLEEDRLRPTLAGMQRLNGLLAYLLT